MKAASTISVRDGHAIVKAGEFIEARFGAGTSPSLAARKTLALLIAKAAGEAWRPGSHVIAKRDLRGNHKANDRIQDTIDELMHVDRQRIGEGKSWSDSVAQGCGLTIKKKKH